MARRVLPFIVDVPEPCARSWASMTGGMTERHCEHCDKRVHNFAAMTPRQIERLVASTDGKICARLTLRPDGSLVTLNSSAKPSYAASILLFVTLAIAPVAVAKTQSGDTHRADVSATDTQASHTQEQPIDVSIQGAVSDTQGSVIVGSNVTLLQQNQTVASTVSDGAGRFVMQATPGWYQLKVDAPGFAHFSGTFVVSADGTTVLNASLMPSTEFTLQVQTNPPLQDTTTGGVLAVSYGPWYKRLAFHLRHPIAYAKHVFHDR